MLTWLCIATVFYCASGGLATKSNGEIETRRTASPKGRINDGLEQLKCPLEDNPRFQVILPHTDDCRKYYLCGNGVPYEKICPSGLHFSYALQRCDYPEQAKCDTELNKLPPGKKGRESLITECPSQNSGVPKLLPHASDCEKFYICDAGVPHLKSCQSGLHFNAELQVCDYPNKAKCDPNFNKVQKEKLGKESGDIECPLQNGAHPTLLNHPSDCGKFYSCNNGVPHLKSCQPGLHFNRKLQVCDYPERAECEKGLNKVQKEKLGRESGDMECPLRNGAHPVLLPHPSDCGKFYSCNSGVPHLKICQSGLHFNRKLQVCDYPERAGCVKRSAEKPTDERIGKEIIGCLKDHSGKPYFIPDPRDCSRYYICQFGHSYSQSCPSGLHFNVDILTCDYPTNAKCDNSRLRTTWKKETQGIPMVHEHKAPGVVSPFCPETDGKKPTFYNHPENCSMYYMCSHGLAYKFVCPARLHFSIRKKACDYEWLAGCLTGPEDEELS